MTTALPFSDPFLNASETKKIFHAEENVGSWPRDHLVACGKAASKKCHKQGEEEERSCCLRLNEAKNGKRMLEERNPALPLPNGEA